ncbi:DNA glycosylase AlkZ-like family protein [Georgenia alba]|uniref:DNA glycosylase AlkZ-like family protein n=1 Tax=Georgenia alba TaxID=2233858 RepID=A0ABW2Q2S8_9MICO
MDGGHRLTRDQARRIAVRAQLLTDPRPTGLMDVVRHLSLLQNDPTTVVAPNAELVLWTRLGDAYEPGDLGDAVDRGDVVELQGMLRPAADIALYRAEMAAWPGASTGWPEAQRRWVDANDDCRRDVLAVLDERGPLPAAALPDTTLVPWRSSGWNNDRSVRMLLDLMVARGEVAVAGREGRVPLWDLAERVYPDGPTVPLEEARRERDRRRLAALGIARPRTTATPVEPNHVGEAGEPAVVDGLRGTWRVDPSYLEGDGEDRAALLSPLDRLVFDRKRMTELFAFDYQLEMYKPAAKRRWGYWAMPVLHGDRLVGKLDAAADFDAGALRVHALHEDGRWSATLRSDVEREVARLAAWLELAVRPTD